MNSKSDIGDSTFRARKETPFVSFPPIGLYSNLGFSLTESHGVGDFHFEVECQYLQVSRMTYFIQCCPACCRRFAVPMLALGNPVECHYCLSVFDSFDGSEDSGEASDSAEQWAREKPLKSEDNVQHPDPFQTEGLTNQFETEAAQSNGSIRPR